MIGIKSCDVDFIESDFPSIGDTKRDLDFYGMEDIEDNVPFLSKGGEIEIPHLVIVENDTSLQPSVSTPPDVPFLSKGREIKIPHPVTTGKDTSLYPNGSTPLDTQDS